MTAQKLPTATKKVIALSEFSGEHRAKLKDGQLAESDGVAVLSGGAVCSLLRARKLNLALSRENLSSGAYTLCSEYDCDYETHVSAEWLYQNVCPSDVLSYASWQLAASRILVKSIGEEGKNEDGYRRVLGAFCDGDRVFVFYEACYLIIDERRSATHTKLDKGYVMQFNSGESGTHEGSITVYTLSQVLLDVIEADGSFSTSLVQARLIERKKITANKYKKSTLASTDGVTYRYVSTDYAPSLGSSYTINFEKVYNELYPTLEEDYPNVYIAYATPRRAVRYSNMTNGADNFSSLGEKLMILPEMRLLSNEDGAWKISAKAANMPLFSAAVQYFDRLFGIEGDTVYASVSGKCTDFSADDDTPTSSWSMVTADGGGFSAITSFGGKVVVFTNERMMTVRGNEKPFTLSFVGEHGCVSQDALAALDGLLYFVSSEGVMCYNGSSVKKISAPLAKSADFSSATLTAADGFLVLSLLDGGFWLYEPESEQWSRTNEDSGDVIFALQTALVQNGNGSVPYRLFDEFGEFSFAIALANGGRRRIKSISVSVSCNLDSEFALTDSEGNVLLYFYDTDGEIVTKTFLPRSFYTDNGKIHFAGKGDCTLYALRIEYASLPSLAMRKG